MIAYKRPEEHIAKCLGPIINALKLVVIIIVFFIIRIGSGCYGVFYGA